MNLLGMANLLIWCECYGSIQGIPCMDIMVHVTQCHQVKPYPLIKHFCVCCRYIAICHPMRAQTMCTVRRAKRIIACLWTFGICYCIPWLALTHTVTKKYINGVTIEMCTFKLERSSYVTIYMADLVIFYVFPLVLTCILYGLIARILFTSSIPSIPGKANGNSSGSTSGKSNSKSVSSSRVQVSLLHHLIFVYSVAFFFFLFFFV